MLLRKVTKWRVVVIVVPVLGMICMLGLGYLFNSVAEEQKMLLDQFSENNLSKEEELKEFYTEFADNHINLFDMLAQASAGGDEGQLYDQGIILLDNMRDSAERFGKFTTIYPLEENEQEIYLVLQKKIQSYFESSRIGIEMATVNLALSDTSIRSANLDFREVSKELSQLTAASHESAVKLFSQLQRTTKQRLSFFFGIALVIVGGFCAIALATAAILKKLNASLKERDDERRNSEAIISSMADALIVTCLDGKIQKINEAACDLVEKDFAQLEGVSLSKFMHQSDSLDYLMKVSRSEQDAITNIETSLMLSHDKKVPVAISCAVLRDSDEKEYGFVFVAKDISQRLETEQQLAYLTSYDSLTNLPNRAQLLEHLKHSINRAEQYSAKIAVLFLDLDQFKIVNDTLGHPVGDELLKSLAFRLTGCVRKDDLVARIGGDEFGIVLNKAGSHSDIARAIDRIFDSLKSPFILDQNSYTATASIGVSLYPDDAADPHSLLMQADTAMFKAKNSGRNQYEFYTMEMNREAAEQFELEAALRRALENNEFELFYQPKISIESGKILGAEALIRWNSPTEGVVPPGKFLHAARESGLIVPIGKWVLDAACKQLGEWHRRLSKKISMAINIDNKQFSQPTLVEDIADALERFCLAPQYLDMELTENILMYNVQDVMAKLQALKNLGVALSIDDFGTGYSSYAQLKHLAITTLKIDRSFITGLPDSEDDSTIVSAIVAMAQKLGLSTVAEGVETQFQFDFLKDAGCDQVQGYLFSKPVRAYEFERLLHKESELVQSIDV